MTRHEKNGQRVGTPPGPIAFWGILIAAATACLPRLPAMPAATGTPVIGDRLPSAKDHMDMDFVPAGEFLMGNATGLTDEQPVHAVTLNAFWIDRTEVTNLMYSRCVQSGSCEAPSDTIDYADPSFSNHPVAFVSWNNARTYCSWARRRLPTEAEWEKAATWDPVTNQQRVYPWGNRFDCKKGNFDDETQLDSFVVPGGPNCDGYPRSSPVGSFPAGASAYGALDMAGNVWEWVHDAFLETDPLTGSQQNYYAISPPSNPQGVDQSASAYRVLRGGGWNMAFGFSRSSYRLWFGMDDRYADVGFRCARSQ